MTHYIRISDPTAGAGEPKRLHAYPGRYLSEREFELLQAYVDDRVTPLLSGIPVGIVSGLELRSEGSGSETLLSIQPGIAVTAGGALLRLFYPLRQTWPAFREQLERQRDAPLDDGLYFLTLRSVVEAVDSDSYQAACTRTESNPLRERRLETVILPDLQFISANPRLLTMPQARAANRICVRFLQASPFDATDMTVPIGLLKIVNRLPEWVDTQAGRYRSEPEAQYRCFLQHTLTHLEHWSELNAQADSSRSLASQLGIDYLPAAGVLPSVMLTDAASKTPRLGFRPGDLQVELAPVPASTINGVVDRELPRGAVDLVHGVGDRIRLLLAIPDIDFSPTLLDLPQRDTALEDELFLRETAATQAWKAWWIQWQALYGGLDAAQLKLERAPVLASRPGDPGDYRNGLVSARRATLDNEALPTPEPYLSHLLATHAVAGYSKVEDPSAGNDQLYIMRNGIRSEIGTLEKDLDESYRLLNEMNDYLNLQRQQLDSLTISFSALAGGVAGDGAGSSMMRWNGAVAFDANLIKKTGG